MMLFSVSTSHQAVASPKSKAKRAFEPNRTELANNRHSAFSGFICTVKMVFDDVSNFKRKKHPTP
jgi:hypothetical protein